MSHFIERSSNLMQDQISEWSEKFDELQAKFDSQSENVYQLEVKLMAAEMKQNLLDSELRKVTMERLDLEQSFINLSREHTATGDLLSGANRKIDTLEKNVKRLVILNE